MWETWEYVWIGLYSVRSFFWCIPNPKRASADAKARLNKYDVDEATRRDLTLQFPTRLPRPRLSSPTLTYHQFIITTFSHLLPWPRTDSPSPLMSLTPIPNFNLLQIDPYLQWYAENYTSVGCSSRYRHERDAEKANETVNRWSVSVDSVCGWYDDRIDSCVSIE